MNTIIDALFMAATEPVDRERFLGDDGKIRAFRLCLGRLEREYGGIQAQLSGDSLSLVERFIRDTEECHAHEEEIAFRQGLAMGLCLGAMPLGFYSGGRGA